jgi:hypothetical protein
MESDDARKRRFDNTKAHFEAILKWAEIPSEDHTVVVDTGVLEGHLQRYGQQIWCVPASVVDSLALR